MPDISIEVWDATGNKKQVVQLPANAAVNRVVAVLVQKMNLPQHSPDGQLMSYKFQHRPTGRQLLDTETLASAGVRDGDIVRLQPEITAGRKKGTGPICRNGPQGASHKLDLSPFLRLFGQMNNVIKLTSGDGRFARFELMAWWDQPGSSGPKFC